MGIVCLYECERPMCECKVVVQAGGGVAFLISQLCLSHTQLLPPPPHPQHLSFSLSHPSLLHRSSPRPSVAPLASSHQLRLWGAEANDTTHKHKHTNRVSRHTHVGVFAHALKQSHAHTPQSDKTRPLVKATCM